MTEVFEVQKDVFEASEYSCGVVRCGVVGFEEKKSKRRNDWSVLFLEALLLHSGMGPETNAI